MYKCMVKTYNLLNDLANTCYCRPCVSVFSTDMNNSSLGARPGGFMCRHKLSSQCALHKHHNLNSLGMAKPIRKNRFCCLNNSEKLIFKSTKTISFLKVFDFHYACRGGYTP